MNDRELLEMAAKAYWAEELDDMSFRWCENEGCILYIHAENQDHNGADRELRWDPLNENGDTFDLAVNLEIGFMSKINRDKSERHVSIAITPYCVSQKRIIEKHNGDKMAASRRAVTLAAAEIGKSMP